MIKKVLLLIFSITFFICSVHAVERPVVFYDARVMAMGGAFCAIADDKNMLFFNPAGFATYGQMEVSIRDAIVDPTLWRPQYNNIGDLTVYSYTYNRELVELFYSMLSFGQSGLLGGKSDPFTQLYDMGYFTDMGSLSYDEHVEANKLINKLYNSRIRYIANLELLSYARHYFGFGFFYNQDIVLDFRPAGLLPEVSGYVYADAIFPVGIGIPVPGHKRWSVGLTYKYFQRLKVEVNTIEDLIEAIDFFENMGYINEDSLESKSFFDTFLEGYDTDKAAHSAKIGTGHGFDLGFMYRPTYAWKFGLLLSDVYTHIRWWDGSEPSYIPFNARIGAAWMPSFDWIIFSDPIIASDIEDVLHQQKKNIFLKWHLGAEIKLLFNLFALRGGINDGYLSYGAGFDLNFRFLSKIPVIKWLRPNRIYFPKFNPKDRDFVKKNPLCCCLTLILAPLTYMHSKLDVSDTGFELGEHPGQRPDRQTLVRYSLSYSY